MRDTLEALVTGRELSDAQMSSAMESIFTGAATPAQIAGFLIGLRAKGETAAEIAVAARVMRKHAVPVQLARAGAVIDTCGTGGDGHSTFNVSTAAALVVAACGVRVAKHGNRAASSKSGSADVLEALGVDLDMKPERIARCIDEVGIGFMFARSHHPAMRFAGPVRAELGVRTLFNFLGPLTNPAGATHQLLGVSDATRVQSMAEVLRLLGSQAAWVVRGEEGLDEISVCGPTRVIELRGGQLQELSVTPEDFGLARSSVDALRGGDAKENAATLRAVLDGKACAQRDAVVANAAAALCVVGRTQTPRDGAAQAAQALDSGAARAKLEAWIALGRAS